MAIAMLLLALDLNDQARTLDVRPRGVGETVTPSTHPHIQIILKHRNAKSASCGGSMRIPHGPHTKTLSQQKCKAAIFILTL